MLDIAEAPTNDAHEEEEEERVDANILVFVTSTRSLGVGKILSVSPLGVVSVVVLSAEGDAQDTSPVSSQRYQVEFAAPRGRRQIRVDVQPRECLHCFFAENRPRLEVGASRIDPFIIGADVQKAWPPLLKAYLQK